MKLSEYLLLSGLTDVAFAKRIGVSAGRVVGRYRRGEAIPRHASMGRIVVATAGAVTANDFYTTPEG